MPVSMQGFAFHTFAAVMTFTVLAFPTPSDLIHLVSEQFQDRKLNEIRSFPTIEGYEPPVNSLIDTQEFVPVISACVVEARAGEDFDPEPCNQALDQLAQMTGNRPAAERITSDEEALRLATTFYCRAEWVEAQRFGRFFDLNKCMGPNLSLAQAVE